MAEERLAFSAGINLIRHIVSHRRRLIGREVHVFLRSFLSMLSQLMFRGRFVSVRFDAEHIVSVI